MRFKRSNSDTFVIDIEFPNCECKNWALISFGHGTSHHPNCIEINNELKNRGFIKIIKNNNTFVCRVKSDSEDKIKNIFSLHPDQLLIPNNIFDNDVSLLDIQEKIFKYISSSLPEVVAKPLLIDRLLYMRYYKFGKFLFHEEYSYIEDEYETRKL